MPDLGNHFAIGGTLVIPFQTRDASNAAVDADSVPTYQIYEQGGTTAVASGSGAKRDDANTTGYYEASVTLSSGSGFERGKFYVIRKQATIDGDTVISLDTFYISGGLTVFSSQSGWPAVEDVEEIIAAAGLELRDDVTDNYIQAKINAVVAEVLRRTRRQFVADADDVSRYFDGTGTGLLEVDDMVSLTSVEFIGLSATAPLYEADDVYLADDEGFPRNRLLIRQGAPFGFGLNRFPQGRRNIKVTGRFGFAATIPIDLWMAVAEETAYRLGQEGMFSALGRLAEWSEADSKEKYDGESIRWHKHFESLFSTTSGYVRPSGRVWRALRRTMV